MKPSIDDDDDDGDKEAVALELEALESILDDAFRILSRDDGGTRVEVCALSSVFPLFDADRLSIDEKKELLNFLSTSLSLITSLSLPRFSSQIDIPDPSGGPASLTLRATLPSRGYPSRVPPTAVSLIAQHLSDRAGVAAVAGQLPLERFVPGAVALFDWVEELRGREELFVVDFDKGGEDKGGGNGGGDEGGEAKSESEAGESDEEDDGEGHERPPSPPSFGTTQVGTTYATVAAEHSETYEVKKSTFVATCFPIRTAAEAEEGIRSRSDPGARHNCWAFVTPAGDDARCSDDGEPGGTAGRPILGSIASAAGEGEGEGALPLRGVAVIVRRWKAGPKLGASGLARAYAHAARLALSSASRVAVQAAVLASVVAVPLADLGKVFGCLERLGATRHGEEEEIEEEVEGGAGSRITLSVSVPKKELEALQSAVASATSGRAKVVVAKM